METHPLIWPMMLLFITLMTGCMRASYNLATQREEWSVTSTDKEVAMGRALARKVQEELVVVADEEMQSRVRAIGERLVAVCDRRDVVYTFTVVDDKEPNAFSLPGGYLFVNRGLITEARSDDELAAVLAHEIAHVAARHSVKRYETSLGAQLVQLATIAAARQGASARGVGVAMQAATLAYARQDELDADRLAVRYLKTAGFAPQAALTFLEHLHELERDTLHYLPRGVTRPHYGRSHPFVPERIRAVKEALFGVADYTDYLNTPN